MGEAARSRREAAFPIGAAASLAELELDPHPLLARLREREPVSWLPALGGWLVTRRDLALEAMRDAEAFPLDAVRERFAGFVAEEVDRLLEAIEADGEAELRRSLAGPLAVAAMVGA